MSKHSAPDVTFPVSVVGAGATGSQVVAELLSYDSSQLVRVHDARPGARPGMLAEVELQDRGRVSFGGQLGDGAPVTVLATPTGTHGALAAECIAGGSSVVSLSDGLGDVRDLFALHVEAERAGVSVVVGAGFAPGLTCLLARHAGDALDEVHEIAVAKAGTGGPACARQHHRAMKQTAWDWLDGSWFERKGGSGRDLVWFPPPIGARDSYKAALPSPLLLQRSFGDAHRIVSRVTATRRDRLTSRLPMLRPPHADGGPGAVRVEVRGIVDGRFETVVYAVSARPSRAAGLVGAASARMVLADEAPRGAFGLSELSDPKTLLRELTARGLGVVTFEGASHR